MICTSIVVLTAVWFIGCYPNKNKVQNEAMDGRPLGNIEQIMLNFGTNGVMYFAWTVIFSSEKPISIRNLERVLYRLAERHSLLRMKVKKCICKGIASDWFVPMEHINIKLEVLPDKEWLDVMERQLSETEINPEEGPLWHVKFLPNIQHQETDNNLPHQCALMFVFNHAICHANSMLRLINETLSNLENELKGVEDSENLESLPLPKSLYDIAEVGSRLPILLKLCQLLISVFPSSILGVIVGRLLHKDRRQWIKKLNNIPHTVDRTGTK